MNECENSWSPKNDFTRLQPLSVSRTGSSLLPPFPSNKPLNNFSNYCFSLHCVLKVVLYWQPRALQFGVAPFPPEASSLSLTPDPWNPGCTYVSTRDANWPIILCWRICSWILIMECGVPPVSLSDSLKCRRLANHLGELTNHHMVSVCLMNIK